eukprot:g22402.t1
MELLTWDELPVAERDRCSRGRTLAAALQRLGLAERTELTLHLGGDLGSVLGLTAEPLLASQAAPGLSVLRIGLAGPTALDSVRSEDSRDASEMLGDLQVEIRHRAGLYHEVSFDDWPAPEPPKRSDVMPFRAAIQWRTDMSKRRRVHNEEGGRGRTDGRTWAIGLCLTVAVLFALASLQVLDVPQIGLTEPHKTIQKANVAEALLRLEKNQKSARLERTALEGGAPSSTLRAEPTGHLDGSIDLVIAAFREDLSWINVMMEPMASDFALRLYCKGDRLKDPRCLRIDNFGGEEYAYLTHITHFYDDLAPITIFTLGSIYDRGWDWLKCRKLNFVLSQLDTPERRQNFPGFATMAHTKPDSFHEFEGFFTLSCWPQVSGSLVRSGLKRSSMCHLQKPGTRGSCTIPSLPSPAREYVSSPGDWAFSS